jgi:preprotein translocase subunit SecB
MAENETTGAEQQLPNGEDTGPQLGILGQYVKDLSFENPNAPAVYQQQNAPEIDVQFEIAVNQVAEDVHEVAMTIRAKAKSGELVAFNVELTYAGLFAARNLPEEHMRPYLYAEAPRLLFPFARAIVADQIRDGAFPPLLLDPIDFGALYQQQSDAALATAEPAGQA